MASTDGGNIALAPQILIYENSLLFLKGACNTGMLREAVDGYIASMATNSVVDAIVESLDYRKRVLELSTKLQLTNDPDLRTALRADEERIATLLVSIFHSKSDEETVLRLEGDSAQYFLDVVQETLDRGFMMAQEDNRMALRMIRKLSDSCDRLPSSLFIVGVNGRDEHPSFGGGFGDIYRASYGGQRVALKRMRYFIRGSDLRRIRLRFCREALVWKDLHHPHILPLLGIDRDSFPSSLCMVSPWMEHGTVMSYLKTHGYANIDKLLYEIAQGLEYLHSRNIVHGDLRGANILITQDWSACLTDFGLSTFSDATSTTSTNRGGSLYWMAPELLDPGRFGLKFARTAATDVYAFGCVCFELYTERPPFSSLPEPVALMRLLDGQRPKRPSCLPAMSDILWQHLSEFWAQSPTARPPTRLVVNNMVWSTPGPLSSRPLPEALPARSVDSKVDSKLTGPYRDKAKDLFPYSGKTDHRSEISLSLVKILRSVDSRGNAKKADESNMTRTTPRTLSSPPLPEALPAHSVGSKDTRPYRDEPEDLLTFPYYAKTYHPDKIYGFLRDVDSRGGAGKVDGSLGGTPRARPPAQSVVRNMVRTTPRTLSSPPLLETLFAHSINNKFGSVGTKNRDAADGEDAKIYRCKAKALYNYSPSPIDDPEDIAFNEGEILDIVDNDGDWWQARKADGSVGTAPSNFLRIIPTAEDYDAIRYRAKALYDYDASPDDSDEISFRKDEMLDIVNNVDDWWQVRKADGSVGTAPSNFLRLIEYHATRIQANALYSYVASPNDRNQISFGKGEILDILDKRGQWWQARKADGSIGIAPSYYLQII